MKEFITANQKKKVIINVASFQDVINLKRAILSELKKNPIGLKLAGESTNIMEKDISFEDLLNFLKNTLIGLELSDELDNAIFVCLGRCTYDTVHAITKDFFDKYPESLEDYYEIVFECVKENLNPFIKSLVSLWNTQLPKMANSQLLNVIAPKNDK